MQSLRARVIASVLLLSAAGLLALAIVTYTEQKSFLQGRIDQEVQAAGVEVSLALDQRGFTPPDDANDRRSQGGSRSHAATGGPNLNLPPGTYGQRRESSGRVIGSLAFQYSSETHPPTPRLPAQVPLLRLFTVKAVGSTGLSYRVFAKRDPEDSGITVVAVPLTELKQTLDRLLLVEGLVILGVLSALALSSFFVVRIGLRPLDRIEVTAGEIAAGKLSRRVSPATGKTEIGRLGLALNAMLDRLELAFSERAASEDRLRQFLADASHELRTPLASIRGYAELFRMGATAEAGGTETAMRRIEEESKRMGVLVEDLLTLARLDEHPQLSRVPVDLAALARDAAQDARATAPDRRILANAPQPSVISGDADQLRQVLANLMRNALTHTPAGTPVEITVEQDIQSVTVTVRDHGPGLPAANTHNLFERFWRAEGGRERGKAGAGLGLAIVREVIDAHHGQIRAENARDGGAQFILRLPKAFSVSPAPPTA